jgi:hypothetical protein
MMDLSRTFDPRPTCEINEWQPHVTGRLVKTKEDEPHGTVARHNAAKSSKSAAPELWAAFRTKDGRAARLIHARCNTAEIKRTGSP